jgi:hypothetical protein
LGWKTDEELAGTTTGPKAALTLCETMLTLIIRNEQAGSFRRITLVEVAEG